MRKPPRSLVARDAESGCRQFCWNVEALRAASHSGLRLLGTRSFLSSFGQVLANFTSEEERGNQPRAQERFFQGQRRRSKVFSAGSVGVKAITQLFGPFLKRFSLCTSGVEP
ncbi:hypothetical protein NDU88_005856 [Pleurodeles waltl]|uniref:Uncharacterized protein n=1 Tax=Pleurodeles waltl TaxID=8319 RepID=A0AAV7PI11_PLEWA|nr:hypothetical protein NDU88_005856 [Pleurodeles waltl]